MVNNIYTESNEPNIYSDSDQPNSFYSGGSQAWSDENEGGQGSTEDWVQVPHNHGVGHTILPYVASNIYQQFDLKKSHTKKLKPPPTLCAFYDFRKNKYFVVSP